jgi:hypothetical protein
MRWSQTAESLFDPSASHLRPSRCQQSFIVIVLELKKSPQIKLVRPKATNVSKTNPASKINPPLSNDTILLITAFQGIIFRGKESHLSGHCTMSFEAQVGMSTDLWLKWENWTYADDSEVRGQSPRVSWRNVNCVKNLSFSGPKQTTGSLL